MLQRPDGMCVVFDEHTISSLQLFAPENVLIWITHVNGFHLVVFVRQMLWPLFQLRGEYRQTQAKINIVMN